MASEPGIEVLTEETAGPMTGREGDIIIHTAPVGGIYFGRIPRDWKRALLTALAREAGAVEVEIGEVGDTRIFYPEGSKQAEMGYNGFVVPDPGKYLVIPLEDE